MSKIKCEKKAQKESNDKEEDSLAKILKTISTDIKEIKGDLKTNSEKMDNMSKKISKLEIKNKENKEKHERRYKEMQDTLRQEIKENNDNLEANISKNVIEMLKPKITAMHEYIVHTDLVRTVKNSLSCKKR